MDTIRDRTDNYNELLETILSAPSPAMALEYTVNKSRNIERERCARIADAIVVDKSRGVQTPVKQGIFMSAKMIAAAIREGDE